MQKTICTVSWIKSFLVAGLLAALVTAPALVPGQSLTTQPWCAESDAGRGVRLRNVDIHAEVHKSGARTRIELVAENAADQPTDGEVLLSLLDSQVVRTVAAEDDPGPLPAPSLEKTGETRVWKDAVRDTMASTVLDRTRSSRYRLQIPNVPGHGSRRVVLIVDEELGDLNFDGMNRGVRHTTYLLPLWFGTPIRLLAVAVRNAELPAAPSAMAVRARLGAKKLKVTYAPDTGSRNGSEVIFSRSQYWDCALLSVVFPHSPMAGAK